MPTITDLTGCTWVGNSTLTGFSEWYCAINFTASNNEQFTAFNLDPNADNLPELWYWDSNGDYHWAYDGVDYGWANNDYRTITITGGTDATNSYLITWLQNNGTLILPDLSNTHWKLNNNLTFTDIGTKSINFKSGNNTYSSITISGSDGLKYNNTTIVEAPTTTIINFIIASVEGVDTTYQAEEGMTWQEWVDSEYNTDGCFIQSNRVMLGAMAVRDAVPTDTIISGNRYSSAGGATN